MTNEELIKEISSLPVEAKRQIEKFVALLKRTHEDTKPAVTEGSFRDDPAFGMWKDREDMKDGGAAWVRKFRKEHWDRDLR